MGFLLPMFWRETRHGAGRLLLLVLSVSAGVAGLVAVKSFSYSLEESIRSEARTLMAADLVMTSHRPFTPAENNALENLENRGAKTATSHTLAAMARAPSSKQARLVDLRAVGAAYPLYGEVRTRSGQPLQKILKKDTAVVHSSLLAMLNISLNDSIQIGAARFQVVDILEAEPDRPVSLLSMGPRVLLSEEGGLATQLYGPTSHIHYSTLIALPPGEDPKSTQAALEKQLTERYASFRTYEQAQPQVTRFLGRLTTYLNLVGLAALLLGGVGVAGAMGAFMAQKLDTLAILKCLGTTSGRILTLYLLQALALGLAGSLIGIALGLGVKEVLTTLLQDFLPTQPGSGGNWLAVTEGAALGLITTLWFSLPPLLKVRKVPPARVFRRHVDPPGATWQLNAFVWGGSLTLVSAFVLWQVGPGQVATIALSALVGGFFLFHGVTRGMLWALARLPKKGPFAFRQGLASLYRPGNQSAHVIVSLGLGVLLVLGVVLVQEELVAQVGANSDTQPTLFFVDLQPTQKTEFQTLIRLKGLEEPEMIPLVRGRLRAINGAAVNLEAIEDEDKKRLMGAEYSMSYRGKLAEGERVIAGKFEKDPLVPGHQVSIAEWWADRTDSKVGDSVTLDIQGVEMSATITSIRSINWSTRRANFSLVFLPGALEEAPQVFVGALKTSQAGQRLELQRELSLLFPNVTTIDVAAMFSIVSEILNRIALVVQFMALFCVAVALVILVGTITTTRFQRMREAALLKTLGATRGMVGRVLLTEYLTLGLVAGLVGSVGGGLLAWALALVVFETPFALTPLPFALSLGAAALLTGLTGLLMSGDVLLKKPLPVLREE